MQDEGPWEQDSEVELTEVHHILSEGQMFMEVDGKIILNTCSLDAIHFVIGRKKNGKPKKLATDFIEYMENGSKPPAVFGGFDHD